MQFRIRKPLDETTLARLAGVHAKYGILKLQLSDSLDGLAVEYDATRLRPPEVEAALAAAGIAVEPQNPVAP